jgi:hypothetical protein
MATVDNWEMKRKKWLRRTYRHKFNIAQVNNCVRYKRKYIRRNDEIEHIDIQKNKKEQN